LDACPGLPRRKRGNHRPRLDGDTATSLFCPFRRRSSVRALVRTDSSPLQAAAVSQPPFSLLFSYDRNNWKTPIRLRYFRRRIRTMTSCFPPYRVSHGAGWSFSFQSSVSAGSGSAAGTGDPIKYTRRYLFLLSQETAVDALDFTGNVLGVAALGARTAPHRIMFSNYSRHRTGLSRVDPALNCVEIKRRSGDFPERRELCVSSARCTGSLCAVTFYSWLIEPQPLEPHIDSRARDSRDCRNTGHSTAGLHEELGEILLL